MLNLLCGGLSNFCNLDPQHVNKDVLLYIPHVLSLYSLLNCCLKLLSFGCFPNVDREYVSLVANSGLFQ